jgi:molybdopterin adenylyltransferase
MAEQKRAAVLKVIDSIHPDEHPDTTVALVSEMLEQADLDVIAQENIDDTEPALEAALRRFAALGEANLIITIGGTGIDPNDIAPEATMAVCQRLLPGIPEAMRHQSLKVTKRALLNRGQAGICGSTLIINLPGSPRAAMENLNVVISAVSHMLRVLAGEPKGKVLYY